MLQKPTSGLIGGCLVRAWSSPSLIPHLFGSVAVRTKKTVYDALTNGRWISDIQVALTLDVQVEYLTLLDLLSNVELQLEC